MIILGIDPSFRNFGMVKVAYDPDQHKVLEILDMKLLESKKTKGVSDYVVAQQIWLKFSSFAHGCDFAVSEIPTGSQSARAARTLGIALGVLACSPIGLVRVTPIDVKKVVGANTTTKQQMIDWGVERFPHASWMRLRDKPDGRILAKNEHLADAIATIHAGMRKGDFVDMVTTLRK